MSRPLMQHGVGQLEEIFAKGKADPKVLKQLEQELQHRHVPRAVSLLAEVQAIMRSASLALPAHTARPEQIERKSTSEPEQSNLWERATAARLDATPVVQLRPTAPVVRPPTAKPQSAPLPTMPFEDACKVLKTSPGATWESIEKTRRLLVQQSNPSLLKPLDNDRRAKALAEARLANTAYATLYAARYRHT